MKLKTKKSLYIRKNKSIFYVFIFLSLIIFSPITSYPQPQTFTFNKTPVSKALASVAQSLGVRISFDAGELQKISISKEISGNNANNIIVSLLENTGYTVTYKHNTFLILKKEDKKNNSWAQHLTGIIYDKETGERLPYASIYLKSKNLSLPATVDGTFSIRIKDSTETNIQIRYLGYYSLDTIVQTYKPGRLLKIGLQKKVQTLQAINITENKIDIIDHSGEAGKFTLNPARFADLPNYGETDIFRALQMFPGISWQENSSQLNIRGSSADQNLVIFDGFTLYNLDHFFGVFSALNPNVIKNVQVYRGGFDSRYGERASGIIDITGKSGNKLKPQFYGGVNLISANLTTEIPISKKVTVVAAGRRAFSDIYSSWLADEILSRKVGMSQQYLGNVNVVEPKFYFNDYNLKLTYTPNTMENIAFSAYGAKDNLNSSNISENEGSIIDTEDINKWGNYGFGISWKKQWNPKYFTIIQAGHSGYYNDYYNLTVIDNEDITGTFQETQINDTINVTNETNDLVDYFVSIKNKYNISQLNKLEFGVAVKYNQFKFYKDATSEFIYNNLNSSSFLYSLFIQDQVTFSNKLTVKPGTRINYYGLTGKIYLEPRLSASYCLNDGLIIKIATGRYLQFLNKSASEQTYGYNRNFWVLANDDPHPVVKSNHFIAGLSNKWDKLFFDIEFYYKSVKGLQEYLFFQNPKQRNGETEKETPGLSRFIAGTGKAYGMDLLLKYENKNITSWLAYSLSKASRNYDEINNGEDIPALFDQTHEFKWTNIYSYKKWDFSTLTLYTTGRPYIESVEKDNMFNTTREYNRLPDYFRIDISANYAINLKKFRVNPGVSILNALNTENYMNVYTREIDIEKGQATETTLIKAQSITFNFFINFSF